jgi:hypothetical protein
MSDNAQSEEMNMSVSPICKKDGRKVAYVTFSDGVRNAEGEIPDCKITHNEGFNEDEVARLEYYMEGNLGMLKQMAASVNPMDAFLGNG